MFVAWLTGTISTLIQIYWFVILAYIVMSWIGGRDSAIGIAIGRLVEPYLGIFRKIIPPIGMFDFSPIIALIALRYIGLGINLVIVWIAGLIS